MPPTINSINLFIKKNILQGTMEEFASHDFTRKIKY